MGGPGTSGRVGTAATLEDPYGNLMNLTELMDACALTQAEFDAQKQQILGP